MESLASSIKGAAISLTSQSLLREFGGSGFRCVRLSKIGTTPTLRCSVAASLPYPQAAGNQTRRIFVDIAFFKGKSAMKIRPTKPTFRLLESGGATVSKEGCLFLEMAPAINKGQYDWSRKQVFALSVMELGTLIELTPDGGCEFYHDPYMGKSDAGMVRKIFKVEPMTDRSGYFFNLNVSSKIESSSEGRLSIPVSRAEFAVLRSTINYIIPHLMGWHVFVDPQQLDSSMLPDELHVDNPSFLNDTIPEWAK